jgi:hypothetical protein
MDHDEIDDYYYDLYDSDDNDIRTFDPEAAYRDFFDRIEDEEEDWVDPDEDDLDLSEIEDPDEEELESADEWDESESD